MGKRKLFRQESGSKLAGLPPGTLIHVGKKRTHQPQLHVLDYNEDTCREEILAAHECGKYKNDDTVTWVTIDGIHDTRIIEEVGKQFQLHPLILEDIVNTNQRSKVEEYNDQIFVVSRMIWIDQKGEIQSEHLSFVLSDNFVICFQEQPGDVFNPLRERIRNKSGRIRSRKGDYLLYALLDTIIDNYFLVLEQVGNLVEITEDKILTDYEEKQIQEVHELKRELMYMQRYIWPMREVTNHMLRAEHRLFEEETLLFVRDLHDHVVQAIETVQLSREMISGLIELSMNQSSNRMNEVMKVLTIIATIFIPLTFVAGVYGMNFQYMPELSWRYGYAMVWAVMIALTLGMFVFFRRKKWL